jgi:CBS-domain-containing membrane protein
MRLSNRLGTLTAGDIMTGKVVVVGVDDSLADAAQVFQTHHITGAPVVDERGTPIGVLSLSDIVGKIAGEAAQFSSEPADSVDFSRLFEDPSTMPAGETVRDRMSPKLVSVTRGAPLVEVARVMCEGHWHRVAVVDDDGSLCGIISTMDVLAALVNAADEAQRPPS